MKTKSEMKKTLFLAVMLVAATLVACSDSDDYEKQDGEWPPMKVSVSGTGLTPGQHGRFINIPDSGATFTFWVHNYSCWWISGVAVNISDDVTTAYHPDSIFHYLYQSYGPKTEYNGWYKFETGHTDEWGIRVAENSVVCTIAPNDTTVSRTVKLDMTAGDIFSNFYIVQDKKK